MALKRRTKEPRPPAETSRQTKELIPVAPSEVTEELIPVAPSEIQDRMMIYRNPRHLHCPECDAHPVVCMQQRGSHAIYRCRLCGHRWEVDG